MAVEPLKQGNHIMTETKVEVTFTLPPIPDEIGEGKLFLGPAGAFFKDMELLWEDPNWADHDGFTDEYAAIIEGVLRDQFRIIVTSPWQDHIEYHTASVAHLKLVE